MHAKERKSVRVFSGVPRCRSIAHRRREALETKPAGIAELCAGIATAGDVLASAAPSTGRLMIMNRANERRASMAGRPSSYIFQLSTPVGAVEVT